jgi:YegS/Rv2252/BmrU family lipid kinase
MLLIVNPRGGRSRGSAILEDVRPVFAKAGVELDVRLTTHQGHASELAETCDWSSYQGICLIGGDGTVHEAACGLMRRKEPAQLPLGVIPGGTGNSLAQHLGFTSPRGAAERIIAGNVVSLDVARIALESNIDYSINIVGWGAAVDINRTAERLRWLGPPRYSLAALWEVFRSRRRPARLTLDGRASDDDFHMILACNSRFTGKGMLLAPQAELADGKLDLIIVRRATRLQMLQLFRRVYDGSHLALPFVEHHQVRTLSLQSPGCEQLNIDGELKGHLPIGVEVLPAALRLFA